MSKLQKYNKKNNKKIEIDLKTKKYRQEKLDKDSKIEMEIQTNLIAKKRFGQNFLVNIGVKNKIKQTLINFLSEFEINNLLEIGPGKGDITEFLINFDKNFRAIEIDSEAITFLENKFDLENYSSNLEQNKKNISPEPNLKEINKIENQLLETKKKDYQEKNFNSETSKNNYNSNKNWLQFGDALQLVTQRNLPFEKFVLFSSLPYNVASRILVEMGINYPNCPFCVIVQKEVAVKLISDKLTFFGAFLRLFYDFDKIFDISGGSFDPKPKVMSSLLIGRPKEQNLQENLELENNKKLSYKKITNETKIKILETKSKKFQDIEVKNANQKIQNLNLFLAKTLDRQNICAILKKLVANPRKTLANNLANLDWEKSKIENFIGKYNYQKTRLLYSNYQEILTQILLETQD